MRAGRAGAPQRSVGVPGTRSFLCVGAQLGGGIENDYFPNCLRPYVTCNVEQLFPQESVSAVENLEKGQESIKNKIQILRNPKMNVQRHFLLSKISLDVCTF